MMLVADLTLSLEPAWPWSLPNVGVPSMIAAALLLTGLTLWTYLGVRGATRLRVGVVVLLRLLALSLTFLMLLRPSFGVTHLEGVEPSKWLVVFDVSESMNVADDSAGTTRFDQVSRLWASRNVQRRLEALKDEQQIEFVKYLGADDLRPDEANAAATGKRTDIGMWLHQLWQKHGHEKRLRGIAVFSDGGDNGTRFSAREKARQWRGVCRIDAFGVGNPNDAKLGKDIALTQLRVEPTPVPIKSKMTFKAIAQAPGFEKTEADVSVSMERVGAPSPWDPPVLPKIAFKQAKDQPIVIQCDAPKDAGEYKLTVKISVQPDETSKENNEISTFVQVVKEQINVLWVDRPRVYEPTFALRYALRPEPRFKLRYAEPEEGKDPFVWYKMDTPYDVIVIGDLSARQFSMGNDKIFARLKEMVETNKTGLLLLGGTEAFAAGGWDKQPAMMDLMPVRFDKAGFNEAPVRALPTKQGLQHPFIQLHADPAKNDELWTKHFDELEGLAAVGNVMPDGKGVELLKGTNDDIVMAMRRYGEGRVVVFAGDTTARAWFGNKEAVEGYTRFWKQLVFWLAQQQDQSHQLWVTLDKRRIAAGDPLGFTFGLRSKGGTELPDATFQAKIVGPKEHPVSFVREEQHQRGSFQGTTEPGEYQLVIAGTTQEIDGTLVKGDATARFLVESGDVEMQRPAADHEALSQIATVADGRFFLASEQPLLQLLDEFRTQVNSEARVKTTQWPDWKRVPSSERARDQLAGIWNSFGLASLLLFALLIGCEWILRRMWGLV